MKYLSHVIIECHEFMRAFLSHLGIYVYIICCLDYYFVNNTYLDEMCKISPCIVITCDFMGIFYHHLKLLDYSF